MSKVHQNISLKSFNSFRIDVQSKFFVEVSSVAELCSVLNNRDFLGENKLILGEGSNILFLEDFDGLVIRPLFKRIKILKETDDFVWIEVGAGENWDDFVAYAVLNGFGGIENLSLIPGSVGACPVQNIGAYGVEVREVIEEVKVIRKNDCKELTFLNHECSFNYRSSIFKTKYKNEFVVSSVIFRLSKKPSFKIDYGKLKEELTRFNEINLSSIRDAIISIRSTKLPNPEQIGNAGSFFKNPVVNKLTIECLQKEYVSIPVYEVSDSEYKVAAGWLIEQCGWKGKIVGNAGVHSNQSLVLINLKDATGKDIFDLSEQIKMSVKEKFGIELEREVNVI